MTELFGDRPGRPELKFSAEQSWKQFVAIKALLEAATARSEQREKGLPVSATDELRIGDLLPPLPNRQNRTGSSGNNTPHSPMQDYFAREARRYSHEDRKPGDS